MNRSAQKRILIIGGGISGGGKAATRARCLDESAEIIVFEESPYIAHQSYRLPHYINRGSQTFEQIRLLDPKAFLDEHHIKVRLSTQITRIHPPSQQVDVRDLITGATYHEYYDALVLAQNSSPRLPLDLPGTHRPGHFAFHTLQDAEQISRWLENPAVKRAVIIGGSPQGIELAHRLSSLQLEVSLIEPHSQVCSFLDTEMVAFVHGNLQTHGVRLLLNSQVVDFQEPERQSQASVVCLDNQTRLPADMVIFTLGIQPDTRLAQEAGLEIGTLGGLRVNPYLQTSDPNIWAVGDMIEVPDRVTDQWSLVSTTGLASLQGRLVADNILGRRLPCPGSWTSFSTRGFNQAMVGTGANEKQLQAAHIPYDAIHVHASDPNKNITTHLKALFNRYTGRILGAQIVGPILDTFEAEQCLDTLATAMQGGLTIDRVAELELVAHLPDGQEKNLVSLLGRLGDDVITGLVNPIQWHELINLDLQECVFLDIRSKEVFEAGHLPGALHIPKKQLRANMQKLSEDKTIIVYCEDGSESYVICRVLNQHQFKTRLLSGGYLTWEAGSQALPPKAQTAPSRRPPARDSHKQKRPVAPHP